MDIHLLIVPYDTARRGWRSGAGPEHLLQAGLTTHLQRNGHIVANIQVIEDDSAQSPAEIRTAFELARRLAEGVRFARAAGRFPLVLSGNCNSAIGTLSGLVPASRAIFWFDAHGDCNTPETTASGFLDGTGLAVALGLCWRQLAASVPGFQPVAPEATFLLGARDLDPGEIALLADRSSPSSQSSGFRPTSPNCSPGLRSMTHLAMCISTSTYWTLRWAKPTHSPFPVASRSSSSLPRSLPSGPEFPSGQLL